MMAIHPTELQEVLMRKQFLAGALGLAVATGTTTGALASDQGGRNHAKMHTKRVPGVRGIDNVRHGVLGGQRLVVDGVYPYYRDGFVAPGAADPYCWPYDYSYPSGYSYCGASYIVSW
jgi:hypothetical protein